MWTHSLYTRWSAQFARRSMSYSGRKASFQTGKKTLRAAKRPHHGERDHPPPPRPSCGGKVNATSELKRVSSGTDALFRITPLSLVGHFNVSHTRTEPEVSSTCCAADGRPIKLKSSSPSKRSIIHRSIPATTAPTHTACPSLLPSGAPEPCTHSCSHTQRPHTIPGHDHGKCSARSWKPLTSKTVAGRALPACSRIRTSFRSPVIWRLPDSVPISCSASLAISPRRHKDNTECHSHGFQPICRQ